jgi:hypothetical protein
MKALYVDGNINHYIRDHGYLSTRSVGVFILKSKFTIGVHLKHVYSFKNGKYLYFVTNEIIRDCVTRRANKRKDKYTLKVKMNRVIHHKGLDTILDYLNNYSDHGRGKVYIHYEIRKNERYITSIKLSNTYIKKYKRKRRKNNVIIYL